jgi:phage anti-repressor protein/DNA-binding Xre family transcriptional regulator
MWMNDLQNTDLRTPIEIALQIDNDGMTTARKLYEFLELAPQHYSRWCKVNITENEFAEQNVDYWAFTVDGERRYNPNPTTDYKLTAHFAKKLSMKGNGERAEQAREYFSLIEEKAKQTSIDRSALSPQTQHLLSMGGSIARLELEQKRQSAQVQAVKDDLDDFKENIPLLPAECEVISSSVRKKGVDVLGGKKSPAYNDGHVRQKVYQDIYNELYRQFGIHSYKALKRNQFEEAQRIISEYTVPYVLESEITDCFDSAGIESAQTKVIANNIKRLLHEKNMRQIDLAEKIGISTGLVSAWCSGIKVPRIENLVCIMDALGVTWNDLVCEP